MTAPLASRRSFITGLISLVAAPAIVRAGSLMPVRVMIEPNEFMLEDCFLRSLFETLNRFPEMTATQLIELCNENSLLGLQ